MLKPPALTPMPRPVQPKGQRDGYLDASKDDDEVTPSSDTDNLPMVRARAQTLWGALGGAILLCMLSSFAFAQGVSGKNLSLRDPEPFGVAAIYAERPDLAHHFNLAMLQYRWTGENGFPKGGYSALHEERPFVMPWLWASNEGKTLRRLEEGIFRLVHSSPHYDVFSEIECYGRDWPSFACSDGQERTMSAPDLTLLIFGGEEFRRTMPNIE